MQGFDPNGPQFQDAGSPLPLAPQPPQGMPQPPSPQQPQPYTGPPPGPSGLTLEQANPDPGAQAAPTGQPQNPYLAHYQQALEAAKTMFAGARRSYLPEQKMSVLQMLTAGPGTRADQEQYRKGYNIGVDRYNAALDIKAAEFARGMMHDQATGDDADFNKQLRLLQAQVGVRNLMRNDALAKTKLDTGKMRPAPKSPDEQRGMEADGWGPDPEYPNYWSKDGGGGGGGGGGKLTRNPDGSWGMPPAPGSPAAKAGLGPQPTGGQPTDKKPGESTPDYVDRKKRENKIETTKGTAKATQAAKTGPYASLALNDLDQLEQAIKESFPAGESPLAAKTTGGGQRWWQSQRGTNPGLTRIETIRSRIEGYIRAMGGASRMPKELMDAMLSGMPALTNNRERNLILVKQMRDSIKAASDEYPEPDASGQGVLQSPGGGSASANQPNKPTARRLSSGKLITEEP